MNDSRVNFNLHDCSNLSIYGTLPNSNLYSYDPDLSEFSTNYVLYSFYYYENYNTSERGHYRYVQCKQNNTFQVTTTYTIFLARTASFLTKIMLVFTRNNCRCCVHENQPLMMLILLFWITLNMLVLVYIVCFTVFRMALQCIVISFFP